MMMEVTGICHLSHAEEDDLMSKDVFIVKVGSLRYLGSLVKRA